MIPIQGAAPHHARKRHFIDTAVQRGLLLALVALEVLLVIAAVWLMHARLGGAIEETLYRVHISRAEPLLSRLSREAWLMGGLFLVINLLALFIAEGIWRQHVNRVLRSLASCTRAVAALDFASPIEETHQHEVLRLAAAWRNRERDRLLRIRDGAGRLEGQVSGTDFNADRVRETLRELDGLLSDPSAPLSARESGSGRGTR